jgi:Antibiotic biosynthesis monooxygenase
MTQQPRAVRIVRFFPKSGCADAIEEQLDARYRVRAGFPGMLSVQLMRSSPTAPRELAIATIWDNHQGLGRYLEVTGGEWLDPGSASLVETIEATEYVLVQSAEYDLLPSHD